MFKFHQDDRVIVRFNSWEMEGRIVGCASTEMPVLGRMWLVMVSKHGGYIPNEVYPFNTVSVPESQIFRL